MRRIEFYVFLVASFLATACDSGPSRAHLQGTATLDGTPLESGNLTLIPLPGNAGISSGATIARGEFRIEGPRAPLPGKFRVEIIGFRSTGKQHVDPLGRTSEQTEPIVPPRYNAASELTIDLKAGKNQVAFDLQSK